jgi:hypothetical protein
MTMRVSFVSLHPDYTRIGGALHLWSWALLGAVLLHAVRFSHSLPHLVDGTFGRITDPEGLYYDPLHAILLVLQLGGHLLLSCAGAVLVHAFFRRLRIVPRAAIAFHLLSSVFMLTDFMLSLRVAAVEPAGPFVIRLSFLLCIVAPAYYLLSERVSRTFVVER